MVSVKGVAFASFAALLSTAASAADMSFPLPPSVPLPHVEEFSGWYLRGDIGFTNQRVGSTNYNYGTLAPPDSVQAVSAEFETGGLFGIGMGGQWGIGASLVLETVPARWRGVLSGMLHQGYSLGNLLAALAYLVLYPTLKDRKSTRLNSSHMSESRMPSSA